MDKRTAEVLQYIKTIASVSPSIGIILGSGFSDFVQKVNQPIFLPYESIPHFPVSTVSGHKGQIVFGKVFQSPIIILQGRFHFYEGYSIKKITFPIKIMKLLGVKTLILTNAAGGIHHSLSVGDFMLITDHLQFINAKTKNGLLFHNQMSMRAQPIYSIRLIHIAEQVAYNLNFPLKKGVYASMPGPSYETPAEIKMLKKLGADAVGMSTTPEAQFAFANGMEVVGISCIANRAAGLTNERLRHEDVIKSTNKAKRIFSDFALNFINEIQERM